MAIVPLIKVTLYGATRQKEAVVDGLQSLGCLHIVRLGDADGKVEPTGYVSADAREALKYLHECQTKRRPVNEPAGFDQVQVQRESLEIKQRERQFRDERDQLRKAIATMKPWGDFHLSQDIQWNGLRFWFFTMPHYRMKALATSDCVWHLAATDNHFAYVVVLSETQPVGIPGNQVELDPRPLSGLERRLETVENELEDLHWRRVSLTRWRVLFARTLDEADDRTARHYVGTQVLSEGSVFALSAWAASESLAAVETFAKQNGMALTVEDPSLEDKPPTLLRNRPLFSGGEDAVKFYMTPGYGSWDPSLAVFASFAVFFGMILADAGYGLVLGVILLLFWRRLGRYPSGTRLRNLSLALVATSVAYGVLVGSYFGTSPPRGTILEALHLLDAQDQGLMMRLSIGVGVLHLVLANLVTAWRERHTLRVLASLGWCAMFAGGYLLGLGASATPRQYDLTHRGLTILGWGGAAVLLFSTRRPISIKPKELGMRLVDGVKGLAGVTQAFGDALSYLRLFALGLAGAQLAKTFNDMSYTASCCMGIGALLGVLVAILGHTLNLALGIMSGVVHGLRLNCIEFFNWSLPEEGYPFRAFCKKVGQ